MDARNDQEFASREAVDYWEQVDLYLGGSEHATGHLLYVRFWTKFLFDMGRIPVHEPAKKLINQGMIHGRSRAVYRNKGTNPFGSYRQKTHYDPTEIHSGIPFEKQHILTN